MATGSAVPLPCKAYKTLNHMMMKQLEHYERLHKTGDLGRIEGMYVEDNENGIDKVPSECVSSFLRGGIIHSMACFEAFVYELLDEVTTSKQVPTPIDETTSSDQTQASSSGDIEILSAASLFSESQMSPFSLHGINLIFSKQLELDENDDFMDKIFNEDLDQPMMYYYVLKKYKMAKIEIRDKVTLCALMRFMYGIRCIMAHGSAELTLTNAKTLKHLHFCKECGKKEGIYEDKVHCISDHTHTNEKAYRACNKCQNPSSASQFSKLKSITRLVSYYDECIEEQGKKEVIDYARFYPKKQPILKMKNAEGNKTKAMRIIEKLFPDVDKIDNMSDDKPLDENYAFYHLCRVYKWLQQDKRGMYITHALLSRINELVLVIANRMRFATANILMKKYKLTDGIFDVPKDQFKQKDELKQFEKEHKNRVKRAKFPKNVSSFSCYV